VHLLLANNGKFAIPLLMNSTRFLVNLGYVQLIGGALEAWEKE